VDAEVVMISGHGTIETAVKATRLGAFDFIEKPLSLEKTLVVVRNALRQRRLERKNRHLLEQLPATRRSSGRARPPSACAPRSPPPPMRTRPCCWWASAEREGRRWPAASPRRLAARRGGLRRRPLRRPGRGGAARALFGEGGVPSRFALAAGGSVYLEEVERLPAALQERLAAQVERAHEQASVASSPAWAPEAPHSGVVGGGRGRGGGGGRAPAAERPRDELRLTRAARAGPREDIPPATPIA
jgi:two-component system nitrogen regulation response regulator NtrX